MRPLRTRGPTTAHQEAVTRRLAQLDAELAAVRAGPATPGPRVRPEDDGWQEWDDGWDVAPPVADPPPWEPLPPPGVPDSHTRVREAPPPDGSVVLGDVPQPGRHASRRSGVPPADSDPVGPPGPRTGWAGLVPETLHGRAGLGPAQLAVVAVLVSLGLGVTCWWVLRSGPEPLPATSPVGALVTPAADAPGSATPPAPSGTAPAGAAPTPTPATAEVVVDVAGKVRRPGIAVLPGGSRVADALDAAGGVRPGVDLTSLNLARVLVDGEQILVGVAAPPGASAAPSASAAPGSPAAPGAPTTPGALVNVNTADLALLDTLPGVGPVTAQAILDWRTENGGFSAVEDLLDVSGIGEVTLAELTPLVTV